MELRQSVELLFVRGEGEEQKLLTSKRGPQKHGAGLIAVPGGHLEHLETVQQAAIRETTEELGEAMGQAVLAVLSQNQGIVGARIDDLRQEGILYQREALIINLPDGVEPDPDAIDQHEHVDLCWRSKAELKTAAAQGNIYPSHAVQIESFIAGTHPYIELR